MAVARASLGRWRQLEVVYSANMAWLRRKKIRDVSSALGKKEIITYGGGGAICGGDRYGRKS